MVITVTVNKKIIRGGIAMLLVGVFVAAVSLVIYSFLFRAHTTLPAQADKTGGCDIYDKTETVNGTSLAPFIVNGTTVTAAYNYYHCHTVQRGDIVLYKYSGDKNPLIKIVQGIPGDTFSLQPSGSGWHMLINGAVLANKENIPYVFDAQKKKMLDLYVTDYQGKIPASAYLILGDNPAGTLDSSAFGLVGREDLLAKVTAL